MQASPVQTRTVLYRKVDIQPYMTAENLLDEQMSGFDLDWNGVRMDAATGCNATEDTESDPALFIVSLRLKIKNETGKLCPYLIDIELLGLIEVNVNLPAERRQELATVNGLAVVYGAARELVTTLTSRMDYGPLVLPGVNFQDQVSQQKLPQEPVSQ